MKQGVIETITGALILLIALCFFIYGYSYNNSNVGEHTYSLLAKFERVDGLLNGNDVRLGGVKIGHVADMLIDPKSYQVCVKMRIDKKIKLPIDTIAEISSESFLGGKYLSLVPGGDEKFLENGTTISYTQSAVSLESLIGKYIFSSNSDKKS